MLRHGIDRQESQKALKILVIPAGLEPAARGVEIRYSIQLSYGTVLAADLRRRRLSS